MTSLFVIGNPRVGLMLSRFSMKLYNKRSAQGKRVGFSVVFYFAAFLCGFAPLRETPRMKK